MLVVDIKNERGWIKMKQEGYKKEKERRNQQQQTTRLLLKRERHFSLLSILLPNCRNLKAVVNFSVSKKSVCFYMKNFSRSVYVLKQNNTIEKIFEL